jgi:hypothetical protein
MRNMYIENRLREAGGITLAATIDLSRCAPGLRRRHARGSHCALRSVWRSASLLARSRARARESDTSPES